MVGRVWPKVEDFKTISNSTSGNTTIPEYSDVEGKDFVKRFCQPTRTQNECSFCSIKRFLYLNKRNIFKAVSKKCRTKITKKF